jgi:SWI/SNF-related matrix-associated actin-dependent regulator 1 of chromatin subfamily A
MTLTYNAKDNSFVLLTQETEKAERVGLTRSRKAYGPNGEAVFYTADYNKEPEFNPYAAIPFYSEADEKAKAQLDSYMKAYDASFATEAAHQPPAPQGMDYLPYQKAGIAYAKEKGDVLIGDEPGLGKTIQALGIINQNEGKRNLIICPASIRLNWEREIRKWSVLGYNRPERVTAVNTILTASRGVSPTSDFNVVSYDLASRNDGLHEALSEIEWDNIVVDECHYLKSTDAKRTQAIFGTAKGQYSKYFIGKKAKHVIGLTGTPLPNRPRECYTIARALCWEAIDFMSFDAFCYRFNPSKKIDYNAVLEKKGRLPELQARLRTNFMIRRLKKDVLKDLPDKRYELTYIEPNGKIKDVLAKERLLNFSIADLKDPFSEIWGMVSTVRREMGEAKVPRVMEHVKYLLDIVEVPKIVLFAHHKSVMDALTEGLRSYGVVQVRGGVSSVAKNNAVKQFIADANTRIFLGQLDAAGFGIDGLQAVCDHVVFAEPAWTPGTNEQAVDRCHRIGQHNNVVAQFLVVEGSLDERVLAAVFDKAQGIHQVLDEYHG